MAAETVSPARPGFSPRRMQSIESFTGEEEGEAYGSERRTKAMLEEQMLRQGGGYADEGTNPRRYVDREGHFTDALHIYKERAKRSNDAVEQLSYVRQLIEAASLLQAEGARPHAVKDAGRSAGRLALEGEALRWLKRLANSSNGMGRQPLADAQFMLAEFYGKGLLGLHVDHAKAFHLYMQASKQNHPVAAYRAAVCYEVGAGTKKDHMRAIQFYRKAGALGDNLAMHKLALVLLYGKLGQRKNLKEGITWLKRACNTADEFHPEALHDLGQCYEKNGGCPVLIADEGYAFELYTTASQFGYAPSQYRLGTCFEYGLLGCEVDPAASIKWYSKAAEQGFPDAELALSSWYLSGSHGILQQSDVDAYLWARKAGDRQHTKAEYQVGSYYECGVGVPVNGIEAMVWYARAAKKGHAKAAQRLVELRKIHKPSKDRCTIF